MMKLANAPCSWGVLEFELQNESYPYTRVLDEIKATGYAGTELGDWGFMPTDPFRLKDELQKRQLEMVGAFIPIAFADAKMHGEGCALALKAAKLLYETAGESPLIILSDDNGKDAARTRNAGCISPDLQLSASQWKTFSQGVMRVARAILDQTGLRSVFHHHCAGFIETPEEIEILMHETDAISLGLCFDTGHYHFGGGDPVQGFAAFRDRIRHLHFKDCEPAILEQSRQNHWDYFESIRRGIFCPLGEGAVDFPSLIEAIKKTMDTGWIVVEQDILPGMGQPKVYAQKNREFLKTLNL